MISIKKFGFEDSEKIIRELEKRLVFTLFHTYDWLKILNDALDFTPEIFLFYDKEEIIGFLPVYLKKTAIKIYFSPLLGVETAYGGIVYDKKYDLKELYAVLKKSNLLKNFFFVQPDNIVLKDVITEPKFTIITDLKYQNPKEHLQKIKKGHRYNINKARTDQKLTLKEDYSEKSLREYYELLKKTYDYKNYIPPPYEFYKSIILHYKSKQAIKFLIAYYQKKPVGTIVAIVYNNRLHYWTGGFLRDKEYTKLYPNDLLQWEIINWGYEQGIKTYDMLGADIEGIRNFKLGFGGELVEYKKVYSNKKLKMLAEVYSHFGNKVKNILRKI